MFHLIWIFFKAIYLAFKRFVSERYTRACSSLTLGTLFALVPVMALALVAIQIVPAFAPTIQSVKHFIFSNFVPNASELIEQNIDKFASQAANLTTIGTMLLTVTAVFLMLNLESIINDIWHGYADKHRWYWRLLKHLSVLVLFPLLMMSSVSLTSYLMRFFLTSWQPIVLPFLVTFFALLFLYRYVPNYPVPFKPVCLAAFVAAMAFEVLKMAFQLYLLYFPTYQILYGALSVLPILILWMYLSWAIVLIGTLLSTELARLLQESS